MMLFNSCWCAPAISETGEGFDARFIRSYSGLETEPQQARANKRGARGASISCVQSDLAVVGDAVGFDPTQVVG